MRTGIATIALLALAVRAAPARADAFPFTLAATVYLDDHGQPLSQPEGVACTSDGRVVVADTGNRRLLEFAWRDGALSGGAAAKLAELPYPTRLRIDSKGNVLVLDGKLRRVARLRPDRAFAGWVDARVSDAADRATVGAFDVGPSDEVVLLDLATYSVLVVDASGGVTRRLVLPRGGTSFTDVAVDASSNIYAVDPVTGSIWAASRTAQGFTALAKGLKEYASFPSRLTTWRGRLFAVDQNGNGVVLLGVDGTYQGRQLGMGWSDGLVYYPSQLCAGEGIVAVADRGNNRVQIFSTPK